MLSCRDVRKLTFRIPLEIMSRTSLIQEMIAKEAINVNKQCFITYETLHTALGPYSTMVVTMIVEDSNFLRVSDAMRKAISLTLSIYSPSTDVIHVTDESVITRDFNSQEIP